MFASTSIAGLSRSAPVSKRVTVASQMSRPSNELPDALEVEQLGPFLGPALEDLRQLVVPVEPVERDVRH